MLGEGGDMPSMVLLPNKKIGLVSCKIPKSYMQLCSNITWDYKLSSGTGSKVKSALLCGTKLANFLQPSDKIRLLYQALILLLRNKFQETTLRDYDL